MRFDEIVIEANSPEEAEAIYNKKWSEGKIYSLDYDEDSVEFEINEY